MAVDTTYHDGMRRLQDVRETCALADRLAQVTARTAFPRSIHKMQLVEHSAYAPRREYTPPAPAWKTFDALRDALPARDRKDADVKDDPNG